MRRDKDALRAYLQRLETSPEWLHLMPSGASDQDDDEIYMIHLLGDQGYLTDVGEYSFRMTAQGHDFVDTTRDEGIWEQTKAVVAEQGGSVTLEVLKSIALAFVKKQVEDRSGLTL